MDTLSIRMPSYSVGQLVGAPGHVRVQGSWSPMRKQSVTCTYAMVSGVCVSDSADSVVSVYVGDRVISYPTHMIVGFDDITDEGKQHTTGHIQEWMQAWL